MKLRWSASIGRQWLAVLLLLGAGGEPARAAAAASTASPTLPVLQTAEEIRRLTPSEAEKHYPVKLTGLLTFFDGNQFYRFIQDDTAGVYFNISGALTNVALTAGLRVEMEGFTDKGEYAPVVNAQRAAILPGGTFPAARPVSFEQLASGQEDSQFVQVRGIVRGARKDDRTGYWLVDIATGGGRLTALASRLPVPETVDLADSQVLLSGVCVTRFNRQRQLFDIRLLVPRPEDFSVVVPGPSAPFALPAQTIASLLQFQARGPYGQRVKLAGTVTARPDDNTLYLQDATEGLLVETRQPGSLAVGDQVEVLGFPARGDYTPRLEDAIFRKTGSGPAPQPDRITADEALKGTHDGRLVELEAVLLDRARHTRDQFLVLQSGGFVFHAYLQARSGSAGFPDLRNDSRLRVTGICRIEAITEWHVGEDWRASAFRLLLRSPADIRVLATPSWWTLGKLLWALLLLLALTLAALGWVGVLRRKVQQQTGIIEQKLQAEAALKERYVDLLENANDMVYTHDRTGLMTSINRAGEELLMRRRNDILGRNFVEFIVPDQQAAARQWLEQVGQTPEPSTAEWDFVGPGSQPIRLEVSARPIDQAGRPAEIEGLARDITERKRLEREILEISNREQRRIGHDLHDGVCQQLVGISYLAESLTDRLRERGAAESPELERVGDLLNQAISQTRGVARGLFPVRLEENGLAFALEELADNSAELFRTPCRFVSENPPGRVESGVALHVYYIAREAVANAARHARATAIVLSLEQVSGNRCVLKVSDDGAGLPPQRDQASGMGLRIMRYRARVIGATLEFASAPGAGTTITCTFPQAP